tara:strand:+ start:730 stop:861 length:132 start_codon:yes stop_codon:yes gene_type:complete
LKIYLFRQRGTITKTESGAKRSDEELEEAEKLLNEAYLAYPSK